MGIGGCSRKEFVYDYLSSPSPSLLMDNVCSFGWVIWTTVPIYMCVFVYVHDRMYCCCVHYLYTFVCDDFFSIYLPYSP